MDICNDVSYIFMVKYKELLHKKLITVFQTKQITIYVGRQRILFYRPHYILSRLCTITELLVKTVPHF